MHEHRHDTVQPSQPSQPLHPRLTVTLADIAGPAWIVDAAGKTIWRNAPDASSPHATPLVVQGLDGGMLQLWLGSPSDDHERGALERLTATEGEHRARNIVSLALAIGNQSLGDRLNDPVVQRFLDRLRSLDAVARVGCEIDGDRCRLAAIAKQIASRFDDPENSRIDIEGPDIAIPARWAHLLAIVFHELGANAIRHGALRGRSGTVAVRWLLVADTQTKHHILHVTWRESGVAPIAAAGAKGFGSRILTDMAAVSSRCTATFRLPPTGLDYRLSITFEPWEISPDS